MPRKIIPGEELERFTPQELPEELQRVDAALLAELYDLARKFGQEDAIGKVIRIKEEPPNTAKEIAVCVAADPENSTMLLFGPGGAMHQGAFTIELPSGLVIWDKRLSIADLRQFIDAIDNFASNDGWVDKDTGERIRIPVPPSEPAPLEVDVVFAKPGTTMPVFTGGPDAETLRLQFDRPEEVAIITDPLGGSILCHKRDLPYLRERQRVALKVLGRHNLKLPDDIGELSLEKVIQLRKEIEKELA